MTAESNQVTISSREAGETHPDRRRKSQTKSERLHQKLKSDYKMTISTQDTTAAEDFTWMCLKVFFHLYVTQAIEGKAASVAPETMKTEPDSKAKGEKLQLDCT